MGLPLALSVHHFITSVGADAGFAAIVGLAILVLLFFAQARETTTLRDELADAEDRMAQLEARLSAAMRNAGGAQAAPSAQAAPGAQAAPAQPAAAGAPATARAGGGVPLQPVTAAAGAAAAGAAAAGAAASAAPAAPSGNAPPGVGAPAQGAATRLIPDATTIQRPSTAAAAAGAGSATSPPAGAGNGVGGATGAPLAPPPSPAPPPVRTPGSGAGAAAPRRPAASRVAPPPSSSSRSRQIIGGVVALLVIAAIVVVLIVATSGGSSSNSGTQAARSTVTSNAPTTHHKKKTTTTSTTPAVVPANVTVAVLNGTATNGLARRVSTKLNSGGYKAGTVTTAADQTHTTTTVGYQPGQKAAALAVAKALGLPSSTVGPIDATTRTVACQGLSTTSCSAQGVVVTVGANLAGVQ